MKQIITAKSAGFCFGVSRAMNMAEKALKEQGKCYCLGEIIHNADAVSRLEEMGLEVIDDISALPHGADIIIRSHGVGKEVYDALEEKNAGIIDATCTNVSRIHSIAREASEEGRLLVIIGAENHPEVIGIRGWCDMAMVFSDVEALEKWLLSSDGNRDLPITMVVQTTQTGKNLEQCVNFLKKQCTNLKTFDTICSATSRRQEEAKQLSETCDAMIVISGRHSANGVHLAEICREHCKNVQLVENAGELDMSVLDKADTIGITAGASTPAWIIKEVKQKMCDEIKTLETAEQVEETVEVAAEPVIEEKPEAEKSFAELLEDSIKTIYNGDTVTGVVAAITPTEVSVDLSTKHSGYIPISEFTDNTDQKIEDIIKIGDTIQASVVRVNDVEGTVVLSKKRLDAVKNWADLEEAAENGAAVEGTVTEENKGGIVVSVNGIRVFVPASQSGLGKDVPMTELLKKKVRLKITEVNRSRRRVVGSIRAIQSRERKERAEQVWNEIEVAKVYQGTVKSLTSYGAFIDIGGVDGMVHVSELSWSRIKQPSDVLKVGDEIEVFVKSFDKEKRKISLGYRKDEDNPWVKFMNAYSVGDVAAVKIVSTMPFGAFAEVLPGVDGLIHISQIANRRVGKPEEVLTVGETVDAKIINIDEEKQKISLSIRALSEPAPAPAKEEAPVEEPKVVEEDALVYEISADGTATGIQPEVEE